jgi:hypothetical protein
MPIVMFKLEEGDGEFVKDILVDTFHECTVNLEGRAVKGIKLEEDIPAKDFFAFLAVFIQSRVSWEAI